MTLEEAAKILTEKMGECWHEWIEPYAEADDNDWDWPECKKCKCRKFHVPDVASPHVYTSADFWMKVWTWAKGQEWFKDFIWYSNENELDTANRRINYSISIASVGSPDFLIELAEFLEGRWK